MGLFNYKHPSLKEYYEGPDGIQQSGDELYGDYQFTSLADVISGFIIAYVGEDKIISRVKRPDVIWHAKRALQELSFDTFRSCKTQEIEVCTTLTMPLPHDYVNYVKLTWVDSSGIEHIIYPARKTSNPFEIRQADDGSYDFPSDVQLVVNNDFSDPLGIPWVYNSLGTSEINNGNLISVVGGAYHLQQRWKLVILVVLVVGVEHTQLGKK